MAVIEETSGRLKITPFRVNVLVEAVSRGLTNTLACKAATISTATFWHWLRRGEKVFQGYPEGETPDPESLDFLYYDLYVRVQQAEAEHATRHLDYLNTAARAGSVAASMWLLEHRYPDQYGRQVIDSVVYEGDKASGPEPIRMVEVLLPREDEPNVEQESSPEGS